MNRDEMIKYLVANLNRWPLVRACTFLPLHSGWSWVLGVTPGEYVCHNMRDTNLMVNKNDWLEAGAKADARMNDIVRNGNDGDHYEDQSVESSGGFEQNENYKQNDGGDLIDRWAIKYTRTEFRAVMRAQVEKYYDRYGDKDSFVSESRKAADYALRLHEYEVKWAAEDNEVVSDE